jgi:hypothetical protein
LIDKHIYSKNLTWPKIKINVLPATARYRVGRKAFFVVLFSCAFNEVRSVSPEKTSK